MRRWSYWIAGLALAVYALDVLVGKVAVIARFTSPFKLGDVGEFLVVLFAMIFFVSGVLADSSVAAANHPKEDA
jgi:hypothetical protein